MASSSLFSHLLLFLLLHAMLLIPSFAQANGHITLGSSLTAQINQTNAWHSPSGDFAFGFRPLETNSSLYLLAIWFAKIADSTVVWYANGSLPVQAGSKVELTKDGKLNLTDPAGEAVWSATDINDASYAAMLDTGNFMIMGAGNSVRWQTFDHPSDTILPSQVLGPDHELSSRLSDTDYSDGTLTLGIQSDGNLVFYNLSASPPAAYWTSGTDGRVSQLVFDESGSIYLSLKDGELLNFTSARNYSTRDFYQRARLDPLGVFRQYVYPKNGTTDVGWTPVDFQPDICTIIVDESCGQNSYCKSRGNESYDCICLPEYFYVNPNEKDQGCQQNFPRQNCDDVELGAQFHFTYMYHVDWPLGDYNEMDVDEDKCRDECLSDCDCLVAIYQNSTGLCWKKKLPVSHGMMGASVDRTALIKVPSSAPQGSQKSDSGKRKILMVIIITSVLGFLLLVSVALYLWKKNRKQGIPNASIFNEDEGEELELPLFDLFTIESATDCFSINNKLGEGGFGPVYKGHLKDGQEIAVKRLSMYSVQGLDQFKTEVVLIAKLQHRNLVRLLGCCIQGEERLLIYEYMQNKSLDSFIFDKTKSMMLNWQKRLDIIIGIARGLLYLHQDSRLKIIHRDLKAGNVLLDKDMNPKISDFGTARIFQGDQNQENTKKVVGTFGYMSPEYATDGIFSVKSDVFSFGVLILEIVSGKKNKIMYQEGYYSMNLIGQAWRLWEEGRCLELLDEAMECPYPISKGLRCIQVGLLCVQEESEDRPTMTEVVLMLSNEGVALPQPKRPGFCISRSLLDRDSSSTSKQHSITANEITVTMFEGR